MSNGLSIYVILLVVSNLVASGWLLWWQRTRRVETGQGETKGHEFDGIEEYDNPLPRWWLLLFGGTLAWSVLYLALYPGLGNFPGLLGWTSHGQYDAEVAAAQAKYGPIYDAYAARPIEELAKDEGALKIGARIFANTCAPCHGADARGGAGFPNLTDNDWLYGGDPETIQKTIMDGRAGQMPPIGLTLEALGGKEAPAKVLAYVRELEGKPHDAAAAAEGKDLYMKTCFACHGADGKGVKVQGGPDLTDDIWLHGSGTDEEILGYLQTGLQNRMPPHGPILGPQKVHIMAAYVYSLSHGGTN